MTSQDEFGGAWTQQKLNALSKYLRAYTQIFNKNPKAKFYSISYVDAFAGTGSLQKPEVGGLTSLMPEASKYIEDYCKGSARRALEVEPSFDNYLFIEKSAEKCTELRVLAHSHPTKKVQVLQADANSALIDWCHKLDTGKQRAIVFVDPFGASVTWDAIAAIGRTRAVDLWILFPYSAINRMLIRNRKPGETWAERLTSVFGTSEWEAAFYSATVQPVLPGLPQPDEPMHKSADHQKIMDFFVRRLRTEFEAVSNPLPLYNSKTLLFLLFFAAGNKKGATTGLKIANDIIGH